MRIVNDVFGVLVRPSLTFSAARQRPLVTVFTAKKFTAKKSAG
jgi:hypothetical protein